MARPEATEILAGIQLEIFIQERALKALRDETDETIKNQEKDRLVKEILIIINDGGHFDFRGATEDERRDFFVGFRAYIEALVTPEDDEEEEPVPTVTPVPATTRRRGWIPITASEDDSTAVDTEDEEEEEVVDYELLTDNEIEGLPEEVKAVVDDYLKLHKLLIRLEGHAGDEDSADAIATKNVVERTKASLPQTAVLELIIEWSLFGLSSTIEPKLKAFIQGVLMKYRALIPPVIPTTPVALEADDDELQRKYGEFREILTIPIDDVINNLVTQTYEANRMTQWRVAIEDRAKLEREKGGVHADLAGMMEIVLLAYLFEIIKKGEAIDMDHVTINWEIASKKLASEKGLGFYDSFRRNALFKWADIIAKEAEEVMGEKGRWYAAGGNWGNGTELMDEIFSRLMGESKGGGNAEFIHFMKGLETDFSEAEAKAIKKFILHIGHYEACLRDYRSKIAIEKLGKSRSAVKHKTGITAAGKEQPQTFLSKLSYKDGKNNDKGKYATALAWIQLPSDLLTALSGTDFYETHSTRFRIRAEEASAYFTYLFGSERAAQAADSRKWKPVDWQSCFPHMDEALDYATTYWVEGTNNKGEFERGRRATPEEVAAFSSDGNPVIAADGNSIKLFRDGALNFEHYEQTWGALNELYDIASTCWATSIEHDLAKMTSTEFETRINEEIGKVGTQAAIALAYTLALPDSDPKKGEIFESIRASIDAYIIYLLGQIEVGQGFGARHSKYINREYEERYHKAKEEMITYIENNGSLHQTYSHAATGKKDVVLSDLLISTVRDSAFKRKPHGDIDHSRTVYNTGKARRAGEENIVLNQSVEELTSEPQWLYKTKSNTSIQEDGK
jgi:hypothetical protein